MTIVSFDKDVIIDYVPTYAGNRNSENPCVVRLRFVPYSRIQYYARLIAERTGRFVSALSVMEASQEVQKMQFVENVESVAGYFIGDRKVIDPAEFYDTAGIDLVNEVLKAMESQTMLLEGQRKI